MAEPIQSNRYKPGSPVPVFKEYGDLIQWRKGAIVNPLRTYLSLMNAHAVQEYGRPIRITALYKPGPFHETFEAGDVSANSAGDRGFFGDASWDETTAAAFQAAIISDYKIPMILVHGGTPSAHWHVGPVATLIYQRGKPSED
jgi:hypothetical protein